MVPVTCSLDLGQNLRIVVVRGRDHNRLGARDRLFAFLGSFSTSSGVARSFMKIPEPTKIASAPSCIISAASAGVAMPPAEKLGTGSLPVWATMRISS